MDTLDIVKSAIVKRSGPVAVIVLCMLSIGLISSLVKDEVVRSLAVGTIVVIILVASVLEMYVYLQRSRRNFPRTIVTRDDHALDKIRRLERQVTELHEYTQNHPAQSSEAIFTNDEKERIQKELIKKLGERAVSNLAKTLLQTQAKAAAMDAHTESARATATRMLLRLGAEVDDLDRRAHCHQGTSPLFTNACTAAMSRPITPPVNPTLRDRAVISRCQFSQARFLPAGRRLDAAAAAGFLDCSPSILRRSASIRLMTRRSGTGAGD